MKISLYLNDFETEKLFSYLRWFFLLVSLVLFYVPPFPEKLGFHTDSFMTLFLIGILYMSITQFALYKAKDSSLIFAYITRCGIVFDYLAFFWLLALTGGLKSPLLPISYLIVIHATIYWRTKGAFISAFFISLGFGVFIFYIHAVSFVDLSYFLFTIVFLWVIGLFGSMIVLRERVHLREKELINNLLHQDYLTELYNHRCFQEEIRFYHKSGKRYILILGDIDGFKKINDSYGHLIGDEVLQSLGKIFKNVLPKYDGSAYRYGGEEFAFILPIESNDELPQFFGELNKELNETHFTTEQWSVTMSFGVAIAEHDEPEKVITCADELLYYAKKSGKNRAALKNEKFILNNALNKGETA
ncbi:GGDEF domain-containing protein [Falsibacillus albus]|uniref:GGDEF domain-containing protein n=1 Tax=Falsibacillus albus TaxID=2478915 RepID=A0A3L7K251_9BACI|nr:GGDEF domain-containing protein [Falsibacillus albus]RLQ97136.1 GGDEF domain-containing protein [Falsibacillus albus]